MDEIGLFDWTLYGMLCRKRRNDLGYKTAEAFAKSVWRRTRLQLTRDILYKIEQGRQTPDAEQFIALNLSLWGEILPDEVIRICASKEWADIINAYSYGVFNEETEEKEYFGASNPWIPNKWAGENSRDAKDVAPNPLISDEIIYPEDYAYKLSEPSSLFRMRRIIKRGNGDN